MGNNRPLSTLPWTLFGAVLLYVYMASSLFECTAKPSVDNKKGPAAMSQSKTKFMKPSEDELKKKLSPQQFEVTQEEGTEAPFQNEYWNNHRPGIYVDVVSGE